MNLILDDRMTLKQIRELYWKACRAIAEEAARRFPMPHEVDEREDFVRDQIVIESGWCDLPNAFLVLRFTEHLEFGGTDLGLSEIVPEHQAAYCMFDDVLMVAEWPPAFRRPQRTPEGGAVTDPP